MDKPIDGKYGKGSFLIANPVLPDPNFSRTVVLLCNHNDQGSFGLVVNRVADIKNLEIFDSIDILKSSDKKIYLGGPVSPSQLFFLCWSYAEIPELEVICPGVHLGMNWDTLDAVLDRVRNPERDIRFYLGYSGWGAGQLAGEMAQRSWLTCDATGSFVFEDKEEQIWAKTVLSLGKDYEYLVNAPVNPQWN